MTSQELYEIVKDVPEAAWPSTIHFDSDFGWKLFDDFNDGRVGVETAEAAFVGAMVRYQIDRGGWVPFKRGTKYVIADANVSEFSSLIEALAAACKENPQ